LLLHLWLFLLADITQELILEAVESNTEVNNCGFVEDFG
jgi:hypothetical protein